MIAYDELLRTGGSNIITGRARPTLRPTGKSPPLSPRLAPTLLSQAPPTSLGPLIHVYKTAQLKNDHLPLPYDTKTIFAHVVI